MKYISLFLSMIIMAAGCKSPRTISIADDQFVDSLMTVYKVPVVGISVIEDGKVADVRMFGNLPQHSPAPVNTLFNIASLTKPLTSTVVLMLVSNGSWNLDEPLYHFWIDPDVANDERHQKLTTRHALSHQSGLPNWRGHEPGGKLSFAFEPGTQWKYSGEGFEYLRQAIEHRFKMPFEKLTDSLLFKPSGMKDTRFYWDETMDSSLYANRYHEDGSAFELETWATANPSNLVLTTVTDYARFGITVMNRTGITPDVYKQVITNQAKLDNDKEWGLGWRIIKGLSNGEYALVHTGGNPGINTMVILLPDSKRGIVIFTNGANGSLLYEKLVLKAFDEGKEVLEKMR